MPGNLGNVLNFGRRQYLFLFAGLNLWILATFIHHYANQTKYTASDVSENPVQTSHHRHHHHHHPTSPETPFTGAFKRFPSISSLPDRQRRMTIVVVWNNDPFPSYLRHFFYTIQMNADVLDLLLLNRLQEPGSRCMDFNKANVNITWGGNIKYHCIDDKAWKRRHVDFMCSSKYGWNCTLAEHSKVTKEYQKRPDEKNYNWRPFRGYVFRDLFANPDNPFWAWLDLDMFIGNFVHYPFNILSQLSILTGSSSMPWLLYMAGQLTAFNMDDEALGTAWKKFPELSSANAFTEYTNGKMPESSEERYWSYGYMNSNKSLPGGELSYGIYADLHGDDYYENKWNRKNAAETYLISGRDVLLVSTTYTRVELEEIILLERSAPIDDLGGIGWTGGVDGSEHLVTQPKLSSSEARQLALGEIVKDSEVVHAHDGVVEDIPILTNCTGNPHWKQCVEPHPLSLSNPPILRASVVRFKDQQPGHILRRLERDNRPRGYDRKLIRHHLKTKAQLWFEFPPFEITQDLILRYNSDEIEVFKIGPSRDETLFYRKEGGRSVG